MKSGLLSFFRNSRIFSQIFLAAAVTVLSSCNLGPYMFLFNEDNVDERFTHFTDLSSQAPDLPAGGVYTCILMSDVHFGAGDTDSDVYSSFLNSLKKQFENDEYLVPRFVICLGDVADGGHHSEYTNYAAYVGKIQQLAADCGVVSEKNNFRVFTVLGNHDLYHNGWESFKEVVYPYCATYKLTLRSDSSLQPFTYYFLDTGNGTLGVDQRKALVDELESNPNPKIICSHYPFYAKNSQIFLLTDTTERNYFLTKFKKNNVRALLGGHNHRSLEYDFGSFSQISTGSMAKTREYRLMTVNEKAGTISTSLVEF